MRTAVRVCVGLGSNLGDRAGFLQRALDALDALEGFRTARVSSLLETEPVGGPPQGRFLNAAAVGDAQLGPFALLRAVQTIELSLGRVRTVHWGPRTVDIDILLYGAEVIVSPRLIVPHPLMHERAFVLEPLAEIEPKAYHPVLERTVSQLAADLCRVRHAVDAIGRGV